MANEEQERIARDTREGWKNDRKTGRVSTDPSYAVDAYKESVARSMRKQGAAASKKATKRGSK